jgi:hypothetical protein
LQKYLNVGISQQINRTVAFFKKTSARQIHQGVANLRGSLVNPQALSPGGISAHAQSATLSCAPEHQLSTNNAQAQLHQAFGLDVILFRPVNFVGKRLRDYS